MAMYRLATAHHCRRAPGGPVEYVPAGEKIDHVGTPSISMIPLDDAGHAARLRADLASGRLSAIPENWRDLPLHERVNLARRATRTAQKVTHVAASALKPGPTVGFQNCDSLLIAEIARRERLLKGKPT